MTVQARFKAWVAERVEAGETRTALAARLGCHPSQLTRFCDGTRVPDLDVAFAIEEETGGAIGARAWTTRAREAEAA